MAGRIQCLARREGTSLNQTALKLLRKGVDLEEASEGKDTVGSSVGHLVGAWTQAERDEFDAALEEFEMLDASDRYGDLPSPRSRIRADYRQGYCR